MILLVSVSAYLLSAIQGVATLMSSITGYDYRLCAVIVWLAFTAFTIYSGSPGVLLTDTIMFLVFLAAALVAVPFLIRAGGGWFAGIEALANSDTMPGILSWAGNPDYLYPDGVSNTVWAVTYGIVWALVVAISPWQTSRYLMAKDEHVVLRSSVWSSMGVMVVTVALYFAAAFVRNINDTLPGSEAMIWAATHVLPPVIGMLLLIGISAAGISSASTFLSLIGFSVVNDILPEAENDRKKLARSRWAMLAVSLVVLAVAYLNPPQIFLIMYFGGTVIAGAWSLVAFGSVWSRRLSRCGAYLGSCSAFSAAWAQRRSTPCAASRRRSGRTHFHRHRLSVLGAVLGSALRPATQAEQLARARLFDAPTGANEAAACRADRRLWRVYLVFGICVGLFFLLFYAIPYSRAL